MKKATKIIFGLLFVLSPTLQLGAMESENERFKQDLLEEIREEIKDLSPAEIRTIINEVEQSITEYIEHYEETPKEQLLTKDELYLQQHRHEVAAQPFSMLQTQSDKSEKQLMLEKLNPKLKMLSKNDYHYDAEKGEIEFDVSKDKVFNAQEASMVQASAWSMLDKGDVLINFNNGSSGSSGNNLFKWGHAGIMYIKGSEPRYSFTIEAPGNPYTVTTVNYGYRWHNNNKDRMAYNYVPAAYRTNKPARAADNAKKYFYRPYGLAHALGTSNKIYCTELVFLAYLSQGINLGNGMKKGSWGILWPKKMYCDADLMYYYRQKVGGGMC